MNQEEFDWVGNATTENFSLRKNQLDKSIELREKWLENIDPDYWEGPEWQAVKLAPGAEDARNNSKASGDHNDLHNYSDIVDDFADKYGFFREAEQEGDVLVNQGMSIVDALKEEFNGPLKGFQGAWREPVYAAEDNKDTFDKIIASNNGGKEGFKATVLPAGKTDKAMPAGRITPDYADNPGDIIPDDIEDEERYLSDHIEYITAIADQSVGRSFNTDEKIRNGDLLIDKSIEVNETIDWDSVEELHWMLKDVDEEDAPQITSEWAIDIEYEDEAGITREAITDRETSMYAHEFEELESVQDIYHEDKRLTKAYLETATEEYADATKDAMTGRTIRATLKTWFIPIKAYNRALEASES